MANIHALEQTGEQVRVLMHIATPAGNNTAGISWAAAVLLSGFGGKTALPLGDGTGGTISAAERAEILAGTKVEINVIARPGTAGNGAAIIAYMNSFHAAKTIEVQAQIQASLKFYGYTL